MKERSTASIRYQVMARLGKTLIYFIEFFIARTVKNDIYLQKDDFPWIGNVEKLYPEIRREYLSFKNGTGKALDICKVSEEQYNVIEENKWDFIPLYSYGKEITEFTALFPKTREALTAIPDMTTAFFSILKADTFIKEHRGAYKGYLRYQLGIIIPVPEEQCAIKIEGVTYHWREGESVVFDDTFLHTAWNASGEERVVLYVDFIRPMGRILSFVSRWLTQKINRSPYVQNALKNLSRELSRQKSIQER